MISMLLYIMILGVKTQYLHIWMVTNVYLIPFCQMSLKDVNHSEHQDRDSPPRGAPLGGGLGRKPQGVAGGGSGRLVK